MAKSSELNDTLRFTVPNWSSIPSIIHPRFNTHHTAADPVVVGAPRSPAGEEVPRTLVAQEVRAAAPRSPAGEAVPHTLVVLEAG